MTFLRGRTLWIAYKELKSFVHCLSNGQYLWSGLQAVRFIKQVFVISSK